MKQITTIFKLIKVDSKENSNKFWNGIVYADGTGRTEWGRVGYSSQAKDFPSSCVIEKKKTEKMRDGYEELKVVSEGVSNLVPALDQKKSLLEIAKKQIKTSSSKLDDLIQRLVKSNIHNITSSTQLKFDSSTGLFQTPMGIVTLEAITDARDLLVEIKQNYQSPAKLEKLVVQYLRLIPHNIGMKFDVKNIFPNEKQIEKENDILDSLSASYEAIQDKSNSKLFKKLEDKIFDIEIDVLTDDRERSRLNDYFEKSKKDMHNYNRVKIREFYKVNIHDMTQSFNDKLSPIHEVFHGTSEANCLSILKSGLKISPPSTAVIAGKMMGNGIYGAINSSKSMGYTFGRWGQGNSDTGWLFLMDMAMGKIYETHQACHDGPPKGYDSLWAKAGRSLHNDELVVYKSDQIKIKYLLEIK